MIGGAFRIFGCLGSATPLLGTPTPFFGTLLPSQVFEGPLKNSNRRTPARADIIGNPVKMLGHFKTGISDLLDLGDAGIVISCCIVIPCVV